MRNDGAGSRHRIDLGNRPEKVGQARPVGLVENGLFIAVGVLNDLAVGFVSHINLFDFCSGVGRGGELGLK